MDIVSSQARSGRTCGQQRTMRGRCFRRRWRRKEHIQPWARAWQRSRTCVITSGRNSLMSEQKGASRSLRYYRTMAAYVPPFDYVSWGQGAGPVGGEGC
eukprot:21998-Eustigmatos_ZCMA.PRE.1